MDRGQAQIRVALEQVGQRRTAVSDHNVNSDQFLKDLVTVACSRVVGLKGPSAAQCCSTHASTLFPAGTTEFHFKEPGEYYFNSAVSQSMRMHVHVVNCVDCYATVGYNGSDSTAFLVSAA